MSKDFVVKQKGPVLQVTLNRPKDGNRFSGAMAAELVSLVARAPKTARIVLIKAAGADFCLGRAVMGPPPDAMEAIAMRQMSDVFFNTYGAFRRTPMPVIAAVQGRAIGFGCVLAAVADITLASADAKFQFPEMGHRIMPTIAMSAVIDRMPLKQLLYLFYSTEMIGAEEAKAAGLVSKVVAKADFAKTVDGFCKHLAEMPQAALYAAKEFAASARTMDASGATNYARSLHATINSASEMKKPH